MSGGVGFYGKLPGAGDFVKRRLPADFIEGWDRHFQRAMETGRRELGERWAGAWRDGPAWRFVLPPQVCGSGAWCGLAGPALDRLGRAFPMVLAAPCTGDVARILGNAAWFDALERVYRGAQADAASVETFDARVAALPPPLAGGADLSARWRALPWDDGQWRLDMPGAAAAGVMLVEAWRQLCLRPGPWCLWWTAGATRLLATRGLPRSHAALLEPAGLMGAAQDDDLADLFAGVDARAVASVDVQAAGIRADWIGGEAGAGGRAKEVAAGVDSHAVAPVDAAAATIRADWLDDEATVDGTATDIADGGLPADRLHASHSTAMLALADSHASPTDDESACALWLDNGRTLVLSADDDASTPTAPRTAARAIRATAAAHAADLASLPGALLTLHAQLRATARDTTPPENGAVLVARFNGASVHLLRFGAAAVWHWRRGVLQAPFVERAAGAGGEFDDLLFGDAWLAMPGIGTAGEPDRDAATLHLEAGDRLLLLATRALLRLPRECLADALALPTCDDARTHLALHAGLAAPSAHWPLAVLGVHA